MGLRLKSLTKNIILWSCVTVTMCVASSCGEILVEDSKHEASGEVTLQVDWGLDQFDEAFREECQRKYDAGEIDNVEQCVADKITELITLINAGLSTDDREI